MGIIEFEDPCGYHKIWGDMVEKTKIMNKTTPYFSKNEAYLDTNPLYVAQKPFFPTVEISGM